MENTEGQGLLQQYPPVNPLNPIPPTLPYPNAYLDAHYLPSQNPNLVQLWDSNSQNDLIHPPGVEPAKVNHTPSACETLLPVPDYSYLQTQAIASSSTSVHHCYQDPNVQLALAPCGTGITEPASITSSLLINQKVGPQKRDIWKKGPKKIRTVQSAWCEFCKIDCNSKSVLDQHKLGRKHKKNLEKLIAGSSYVLTQYSAPTPAQASASVDIPAHGYVLTQWSAPTPAQAPASVDISAHACVSTQWSAQTPAQAPSSTYIPAPTALVIGPNGNLDGVKKVRKKAAANEDLETKMRKMLEGGVAAKDVRMCTICNVVCNSEMVYMKHLAGQKHTTMMKNSSSKLAL